MMSPGFTACPEGMFSVAGTTVTQLDRKSELARSPPSPRSTAAPPDMSIFISCILAAGLIEMPPVSKVTALPTSAERARPPPPS